MNFLSIEEDDEEKKPPVHNHGIDPSCEEYEVEPGILRGRCMDQIPKDASDEYRLKQGDQKLNINQLASHFGRKRYFVAEKLAGLTPAEVGNKGAKFFWLSDVEDILSEGEVQGKATEKAEGQARKINAEADLKELEVKKRTGEVIDVSDVEQGAVELFRALHTRLVNYCSESALELSKLTTRGEVEKAQKEGIGTILQALRDDPNNFITKHLDSETR